MPHPYYAMAVVIGAILLVLVGILAEIWRHLRTWIQLRTGRAHIEYRDGVRIIVRHRK